MTEQFKVVSLSHKKAPVEIRELISLDEHETKAFYIQLKEIFGLQEVLILSTCNRTEIYYKSEDNLDEKLIKSLCVQKGIVSSDIHQYFETMVDHTVQYLFEVSLGLQSQVIGDLQIPNQIKLAYQWAADMEMAGPFLHRLMHTVFYANKRIVQETSFRDGAASTSYVTVDIIESFLPAIPNAKILVLGLGEIGTDVVKTLFEKEHKNISICNRTLEKANVLAEQYGAEVIEFENLNAEIQDFDVIISSIRCEIPLFKASNFRQNKGLVYVFDLSVPRSILDDENLNVVLYSIDDIQKRSELTIQKRLEAVPQVNTIIAEMVEEVNNWTKEQIVSPTIQKFKTALELIRKEEMSRYLKSMTEEEIDKMDKITSSMMQKIIKLPVLQLKAACQRGDADNLIDVLNDLFNLEKIKQ